MDTNENVQPKAVGDAATDAAIAAFVQWLITQLASVLPFLAWPGVGWLIGLFLNPFLITMFNQLKLLLNIDIINLVVNDQKEKYDLAVAKLGTVISNPTASAADLAAAKQAFKDSFQALIHSTVKRVFAMRRGLQWQSGSN